MGCERLEECLTMGKNRKNESEGSDCRTLDRWGSQKNSMGLFLFYMALHNLRSVRQQEDWGRGEVGLRPDGDRSALSVDESHFQSRALLLRHLPLRYIHRVDFFLAMFAAHAKPW